MASITAMLRIRQALRSNSPLETDFNLSPRGKEHLFCEEDRKWLGSYIADKRFRDEIFILINGMLKQFNSTHVLPELSVEIDQQMKYFHDTISNFQPGCHPNLFGRGVR